MASLPAERSAFIRIERDARRLLVLTQRHAHIILFLQCLTGSLASCFSHPHPKEGKLS
jgi:hypothetical protein